MQRITCTSAVVTASRRVGNSVAVNEPHRCNAPVQHPYNSVVRCAARFADMYQEQFDLLAQAKAPSIRALPGDWQAPLNALFEVACQLCPALAPLTLDDILTLYSAEVHGPNDLPSQDLPIFDGLDLATKQVIVSALKAHLHIDLQWQAGLEDRERNICPPPDVSLGVLRICLVQCVLAAVHEASGVVISRPP